MAVLPEEKQGEFKVKSAAALKYLLGLVKELQLCALHPITVVYIRHVRSSDGPLGSPLSYSPI